jgi:soluble lytic murein transglycosylase
MNGMHIKSDYYYDAAYEIGRIFFDYSEYEYAVKFAAMVPSKDISLYREAIILEARSYEQMKQYDAALDLLRTALPKFTQMQLTPVIHIRIASILAKKKDYSAALDEFAVSLKISSEGWQGATAGKESYLIIKAKKAVPTDAIIGLAAKGLVSAKEYDKALELLNLSQSTTIDIDSIRVAVYCGQRKTALADKIIMKYQEKTGDRYHLNMIKADMLWENGRRSESVSVIRGLIKVSPQECRKQFRRICFYMYENNSADASVYCSLYENVFPNDPQSGKMLWYAAKPYIEKRNFSTARKYLLRVIEKHPASDYAGNARFWMYKILISENNRAEAEKLFQSMPVYSPGSAYTWILMNRKKNEYDEKALLSMFDSGISSRDYVKTLFAHAMLYFKNGNNGDRNDRLSDITSSGLNQWDRFNKESSQLKLASEYKDILPVIEKYYAAGDSDNIQRVLNIMISSDDADSNISEISKDKTRIESFFGYKYRNYYQQISGTSDLLELMNLQENIFLMSDETVSRILPAGFRDLVRNSGKEFSISEPLMFAVIKNESAFNTRAVSSAGALGLMQLMPPTAKDIAKNLKLKVYDMKRPSDAIRFGGYYLAWLNRFFRGNLREMVAGYNAGPGNVQQWKQKYKEDDTDLFAERVPFDETRSYMLRIDKYYLQYNLILKR